MASITDYVGPVHSSFLDASSDFPTPRLPPTTPPTRKPHRKPLQGGEMHSGDDQVRVPRAFPLQEYGKPTPGTTYMNEPPEGLYPPPPPLSLALVF